MLCLVSKKHLLLYSEASFFSMFYKRTPGPFAWYSRPLITGVQPVFTYLISQPNQNNAGPVYISFSPLSFLAYIFICLICHFTLFSTHLNPAHSCKIQHNCQLAFPSEFSQLLTLYLLSHSLSIFLCLICPTKL